MKKALVTGITGQLGSYLAEILLEKGYEVHGIIRRSSSFNTQRLNSCFEKLHLYYGDLTDALSIDSIIQKVKPDEIYNLGAQSMVRVSFDIPVYTTETIMLGTLYILEAVRKHCPTSKIYTSSTSEMLGGQIGEMPITGFTEKSAYHPRSPYGAAKLGAHWMAINYRESYGMFVCSSILFNNESPRRGNTFVTKKIVNWFNLNSKLIEGKSGGVIPPLLLGNLYAKRDWGYSLEYANAIYLIMQQTTPKDYIVSTGETHTIKEFIEECCNYFKYSIKWEGEKKNEIGYINGLPLIHIDQKYYRPAEVDVLLGDSSLIKKEIGWEPKVKFKELVRLMIEGQEC